MARRSLVLAALFAVALGAPDVASAQSFGIGPRVSFVRGDLPSNTPSVRFFGGTIRMRSSRRVALEVALDYRSLSDATTRIRETPLQGSLLLFPMRGTFSPYVLGGFGLYSRQTELMDETGEVELTVKDKDTGMHLGFGAEIFVGRHAAFFADYRYRFVKFGSDAEDDASGLIPGVDALKFSHRGSMWTSGVAFYF